MYFNVEPLEAGWVVKLLPHRSGESTPPCIWAGVPGKCRTGCKLDTNAYGHPIAILDARRTNDDQIELQFVAVSTPAPLESFASLTA